MAELVARKGDRMQDLLRSGSVLFPGALEFIREAAAAVPIAIASGALRHEIDEIIDAAGVGSTSSTRSSRPAIRRRANRRPRRIAWRSSSCASGRVVRSIRDARLPSRTRAGVSSPHAARASGWLA